MKNNRKKVPLLPEYIEAYQADIHKQRDEYVDKLTPEEQIKCSIVDSVVKQFKDNNIPYFLYVNTENDDRKFWFHQGLTFGDKLSKESIKSFSGRLWTIGVSFIKLFVQYYSVQVVICDKDNEPLYVCNDNGFINVNELDKDE